MREDNDLVGRYAADRSVPTTVLLLVHRLAEGCDGVSALPACPIERFTMAMLCTHLGHFTCTNDVVTRANF